MLDWLLPGFRTAQQDLCTVSLSLTWHMEIEMTTVEIEAEIAQSSMDQAEIAASIRSRTKHSSSKIDTNDDTEAMG